MAATRKRASGVVVPHSLSWHKRLAAFLLATFIRFCILTWRLRWQDLPTGKRPERPVIYCMWHNRIPIGLACFEFSKSVWQDDNIVAMISASRDGGFITDIVQRFGMQSIRGSTSRRGPQALLEATGWLERDYSVAITPDGPRGPVYRVQDGIIQLSKISGRPIIPVSTFTHWKIRLKSWDRLQIPLPFTRCDLRFGEPIWVPRDATDAQFGEIRLKLEQIMNCITYD